MADLDLIIVAYLCTLYSIAVSSIAVSSIALYNNYHDQIRIPVTGVSGVTAYRITGNVGGI